MKKSSLKLDSHIKRVIISVVIALAMHENVLAQTEWSLEVQPGIAVNVPLTMVIYQKDQPDFRFNAHYKSESFKLPPYYECRISRWHNNSSWELELIHHKMYLTNPTSDIDHFSISHGFNMLTLNRGLNISGNIFRAGLGIVIAHPEFTIRNISFDNSRGWFNAGYLPAGVVLNLGYSRHLDLSDRFFINVEAKTTFGFTRISQDDLMVDNYHWAFHLIFGPGYYFLRQRR